MPDAPIVDCHAHIFTRDMPLSGKPWIVPDYDFTAETYLDWLDKAGIHFGVIAGISLYGQYNDYMLEKLRQYKRLRGTVNILPTVDYLTLRDMKDAGVVGMRLFLSATTVANPMDIQGEDCQRLFRRIRDLDWHVHVLAEAHRMGDYLPILEKTGMKLVVDHYSNPEPRDGFNSPGLQASLRSIDTGRTWLKISGSFRLARVKQNTPETYAYARQLEKEYNAQILQRVGPDRLLWGSDAPFVGHEGDFDYQYMVDSFYEAVPDPAVRRAISDTALKLYFS